jgi:hypothetical protein
VDRDGLPVGRALDALVATHVCRWTDVQYFADKGTHYGWAPDATVEDYPWPVPAYSTDMRAAWAVIHALRARALLPAFLRELGRYYQQAASGDPGDEYRVLAAFFADRWAAATICRVALRVVAVP